MVSGIQLGQIRESIEFTDKLYIGGDLQNKVKEQRGKPFSEQ